MPALSRPLAGLVTAVAVLAALLTPGSPAYAAAGDEPGPCTIDWDHGAGTDAWMDPANWSGDRLPGVDDVVCISAVNVGHSVLVDAPDVQQVRAVRSNAALRVASANGTGLRTALASYVEGLFLESGRVQADGPLLAAVVEQSGGSFGGPGDVTVETRYRWYGGYQFGSGTTTVTGADADGYGLYVDGDGTVRMDSRTLQVERGMHLDRAATIHLGLGGRLVTRGTSLTLGGTVEGDGLLVVQGTVEVEADRTFVVSSALRVAESGQLAPYAGGIVRIVPDEGLDAEVNGSVALDDTSQVRTGRDVVFTDTSRVVGPGTLGMAPAAGVSPLLALNGEVDVRKLDAVGGELLWVTGPVNADEMVLRFGKLVAPPGKVTAGTLTVSDAELAGSVHVSGDATVEGTGRITGPTATLDVDGRLSVRGTLGLDEAALEAANLDLGAADAPESTLDLTNGSTIDVAGTLTTTGETVLSEDDSSENDLHAGTLEIAGRTRSDVLLHVRPDDSLEVTASGRLQQDGDLTQRGTARIFGTLVLNGTNLVGANLDAHSDAHLQVGPDATVLIADDVRFGGLLTDVVNLGTITGAGTLEGSVVNKGRVVPQDVLKVWGRYTQTATGRLRLRVDAQQADQLAVDGRIILDGTLALRRGEGAPLRTDITDVVTSTERTGEFAQVESSDSCSELSYGLTTVTLVPQPCALVEPASGAETREQVVFELRVPRPLDHLAVVHWTVRPDTASAADFSGDLTGRVTLLPGETYGRITVGVVDDDEQEPDETFGLELTGEGIKLATDTVAGLVIDDDEPLDLAWKPMRVRQGGIHYDTGLGTSYAVGVDAPDADTELGWQFRIGDGTFSTPRDGFLPYGMNDEDVAVGDCAGGKACVRDHGVDTVLGDGRGDPAVVNDHGVIGGSVGNRAAYWPNRTSAPVMLGMGDNTRVSDINERGEMVGTSISADGTRGAWYRSTSGRVHELPLVEDMTDISEVSITDDGLVAGTAYVPDQWGSGPHHGFTWRPGKPLTDLGADTSVMDVNGRGDMVGMWRARAALWKDGKVTDLNKALPKDVRRNVTLYYGKFINDQGTILVSGSSGSSPRVGGVLVPSGAGCHVCVDATVEEAVFPNPDAFADARGTTVEGTPARVRVVVRNNTADSADLRVAVAGPDGEPLGDVESLTLAPREERVLTRPLRTQGLAWNDGADRGPVDLAVGVTDVDGTPVADRSVELRVLPRPVVAVPGTTSAAGAWSQYDGFTRSAHEGWHTFAVDTMSTPGTVAQDAGKLADYVKGVQVRENAWQVDLVAHATGGLVSRYYVANLMAEHDGIRAAHRLLMLGTPNAGTPCADLFTAASTAEMRTDLMAWFNTEVTARRGVLFSAAAGDPVPSTCGTPVRGDGLVPADSALAGVEDVAGYGVAHHELTTTRALFDEFVLPRLTGPAGTAPAAGATLTAPLTALASSVADVAAAARTPQVLARDLVTVPAGESRSVAVPVPAGLSAVGAAALAPSSVLLELAGGGATATSADDPGRAAGVQTARVANPARGNWSVTVTNQGAASVTVPVTTWAEGSATRLEAKAEQVGIKGRVRVTATLSGDRLDHAIPFMMAVTTGADGQPQQVELTDDGQGDDKAADDGVWTGSLAGLRNGPTVIDVNTNDGSFWRMVSTALVLKVGSDGPGNDAPIALSSSVALPAGDTTAFEVEAADPEDSPLQYEVLTQPQHGKVGGTGPRFEYRPDSGYQGPDSFTWRAFDGELFSSPATVSIDVGPARSQITLGVPADRTTSRGKPTQFLAGLRAIASGQGIREGDVTFEFAGHTVTVRLDEGGPIEAVIPADVPTGDAPLTIRYRGSAHYAPSTLVETIHVVDGNVPRPKLLDVTGEAGYPVRYDVSYGDQGTDIEKVEIDLTADGTWDVELPGAPGDGTYTDYVFEAPFDGTARARVTDWAGNVVEARAAVHIKPHRPLGALSRLLVDGDPVMATDLSDDGRYVLFRKRNGPAAPLEVLDRRTGEHQAVSVLPNGTVDGVSGGLHGRLSPNGRMVAFTSTTWSGGHQAGQVYLRDLDKGTTVLVSQTDAGQPGDWGSSVDDVDDEGAVLFSSTSANLAGRDINACHNNGPCTQLYLHHPTGRLERVSSPAGGPVEQASDPTLSRNARWIAYADFGQLWAVDRQDGSRRLLMDRDRPSSYDYIEWPRISDDGRDVWFMSDAEGLAPEDTNGDQADLFHLDAATGKVDVVSITPAGVGGRAGGGYEEVDRSGNVVFWSPSDDLVADDTNGEIDVFRRAAGSTKVQRLSVEARDGVEGQGYSMSDALSGDGRWLLFHSEAPNLVPGDVEGGTDSFLLDLGWQDGGDTPPTQHAPTAADVMTTVDEDASGVIHLEGSDEDGDELTYEVVDGPQHGVLTGTAADRSYTPAADWSGTDTFTYRVSDGTSWSATATATVVVRPVNDAPTAGPDQALSTDQDTSVAVHLTGHDKDGDALAYEVVEGPKHGTLSGTGPDRVYTPAAGWSGTDTLTWRVTDGQATSATSTVTITVTPKAPAPGWPFDGFYAPVDNAPVVNVVQPGSSVPVKFGLGGYRGTDIFADGYPASVKHSCSSTSVTDVLESTDTPGASGLTYDEGTKRYHYVWKTQKGWSGQCRTLVLRFRDGSEHTAEFRFR